MNIKNNHFKISCDVDEVLLPCVPLAIELANEEFGFKEPITMSEVTQWGASGKRTDVLLKYYNNPGFYKKQKPLPGAKEFIKTLTQIAEVFLVTSVQPEVMSTRAETLLREFPQVPLDNIVISSRKDIVNADIMLDDNPNHILQSSAKYPVLMRQPWNHHITGTLAVTSYDEFLRLFEEIKGSYSESFIKVEDKPYIIALVGPSGSGKNAIATALSKQNGYKRLKSYTTKPKQEEEKYHYLSEDEFLRAKLYNEFYETSIYAGYHFGTKEDDINQILNSGNHAVIPIDIAGAIALKAKYSSCITIYVEQTKEEMLKSIIMEKNYEEQEKISRILSLDVEMKNRRICNFSVKASNAIDEIIQILEMHKT